MIQQKKYTHYLIIVLVLLVASCSKSDYPINSNNLELISNFTINVEEPSGLAINRDETVLYTVSDNTNNIYKLSLTGNVLQEFIVEGNDLEGISVVDNNTLLIAEERTKEIIEFNIVTNSLVKHLLSFENNKPNEGIEGVAYNTIDNTVFVLNEKNPGLLIRLQSDFSIQSTVTLDFASDYSGIFHDSSSNVLWIVSDQDKTVNKCSLKGRLLKSYQINVNKAEGIVVSKDKIYVISDTADSLYIFKKPI